MAVRFSGRIPSPVEFGFSPMDFFLVFAFSPFSSKWRGGKKVVARNVGKENVRRILCRC